MTLPAHQNVHPSERIWDGRMARPMCSLFQDTPFRLDNLAVLRIYIDVMRLLARIDNLYLVDDPAFLLAHIDFNGLALDGLSGCGECLFHGDRGTFRQGFVC